MTINFGKNLGNSMKHTLNGLSTRYTKTEHLDKNMEFMLEMDL